MAGPSFLCAEPSILPRALIPAESRASLLGPGPTRALMVLEKELCGGCISVASRIKVRACGYDQMPAMRKTDRDCAHGDAGSVWPSALANCCPNQLTAGGAGGGEEFPKRGMPDHAWDGGAQLEPKRVVVPTLGGSRRLPGRHAAEVTQPRRRAARAVRACRCADPMDHSPSFQTSRSSATFCASCASTSLAADACEPA